MATDTRRIDLLSASSYTSGQPHDQFDWLRENDPVHWHAEPGGPGFWAVTGYSDVRAVSRDTTTFSSTGTILINDETVLEIDGRQMMLTLDPPGHTSWRRLANLDFRPPAVRDIGPRLQELVTLIVDDVIERGECDLVTDVAGLLPSYVIAEVLGIPHSEGVRLYQLTEIIHSSPEVLPPDAIPNAIQDMVAYGSELFEQRRKDPGTDIVSRLAGSELDGRPVDAIDFAMFFTLLVDAGGDTTRNLVSGGMQALFEHPEQRAWLESDLGRLPTAVEELLRWVSPVIYMRRTATVPTTLAGARIAAGDKVVTYFGSANRDSAVFDRPHELDLARRPNEHIAFGGGGPHFCMGAQLARLEIRLMLAEILTRMPDIAPAGDVEWLPSSFISGPKHQPVRFTPGRRSRA
ncbi:MAG TPA: cytochrome P450 [Pseudonocardia sp.]|nr:cytochrome P450 [Pseudonocardia sp.]